MVSAVASLHEPDANDMLVVHRDIKTSNILIRVEQDGNEVLVLSDFGNAILIKNGDFTNGIAGTRSKIVFLSISKNLSSKIIIFIVISAPETFGSFNGVGYNQKCDIWSIGCVILEIAIGKNIWPDDKDFEFDMTLKRCIPNIPEYLDEKLKDFLAKCFEYNPLERPSAATLLNHAFLN